ncbi:MAG TPA: DUF3305 domain-containing protein [Ramlibacter sp.]|nr:DUF3305 domain-containing protein [Ramlibacter sp.]
MSQRPSVEVAVIMRRERIDNRWQPWRWSLADVVAHESAFGAQPRLLFRSESEERWLHPGFTVELFRDDAEGYYLNLTTPAPCWFVLWRMEERASVSDEPIPRPEMVSLSYHDAGRWLDAQETVEQVPAPQYVIEWMRGFTDEHYVVEPKKRKRPESFKPLQDRFGNPASISTDKKFGEGTP